MRRCVVAPAEVRQFCEHVSSSASKSLVLLRAIEQTVDWLVHIQRTAQADATFASSVAEKIKSCDYAQPLDEDDSTTKCLEELESTLERLHAAMIQRRESARSAKELDRDDRTAVVGEYTNAIAAIADLHSAVTDMKWAIMEHDADLDREVRPQFSDVDELMAYLHR